MKGRRAALLGLFLLFSGLFLYWIRGILAPFVISFIIAYLLDPLLDKLQLRGWSRLKAIVIVYLFFFLVFGLIVLFLVPRVAKEINYLVDRFPSYKELRHWSSQASGKITEFEKKLVEAFPALEKIKFPVYLREAGNAALKKLTKILPSFLRNLYKLLSGSISLLLMLFLIPIVTYYFLQEFDPIRLKLISFVPETKREKVLETAKEIGQVLGGYVRGLIVMCILVSLLTTLVFWILRLDYAIILGIISGICYAVPYVGIALSVVLAVLVGALVSSFSFVRVLVMVMLMLGINQVCDSVIAPRVIGKKVGLHPLITIFALLAGGYLWGLVGVVVAVPLAASIKVVLHQFFPQVFRPVSLELEGAEPKGDLKAETDSQVEKAEKL